MLFECISYRWSPGIGDPTFIGWLTVAAYIGAAAFSLITARAIFSHGAASIALRTFWIGLSIGLVALAANKQLDLQSLGTATGRCLATAQGWYEARRSVQREFILAMTGVGAVAFVGALWIARRRLKNYAVLFVGVFALGVFIFARASSFHHMDTLINTRIVGARMNWILELGAISLIVVGISIARAPARRRGLSTSFDPDRR